MTHKRSRSEQLLTVTFPAILLLFSSLYLLLTDLFRLQPYVMLCVSGLLALPACLLWGGGLYARMIRPGVRLGVGVSALLLAVWSLLYFLSGLLAAHPIAPRVLTACSALPPLLLPAFLLHGFSCALRPADRQQPYPVFWVLLGVGVLGSILSLIGIVHPILFSFVGGEPIYGPGMAAVFAFFCLGTAAAQLYLLYPVRRSARRLLPPLLSFVIELGVFVCMVPGISLLPSMLLPYVAPLLLFSFCSLAEQTALLPDGRSFPALLQHATLPVQLMDLDGTILLGSDLALPVTSAHKSAIQNNRYHVSISLNADTQLIAAAIRGGYALRQKDLRDLHALETALDAAKKELTGVNGLLSQENELERQLREATLQNEFFARQERKIQEKTLRASLLLRCAAAPSPEPGFRRSTVTRANVLVSYIQQLGLLLRQARETGVLPVAELTAAMESSAQAVTAAGPRCRVYSVAQGAFPAEVILTLFDLQELLLENALAQNLPAVELRLRNEQSGLRLVVSARSAETARFPAVPNRISDLATAAGGTIRITEDDGSVSVCVEFLRGGARHA
ncbi:MAG: hypothetical protein VB055_02510 [Oscillospiraceae bacterium]|nr:hypothetical protein [Oscillospiraceae bacterium]